MNFSEFWTCFSLSHQTRSITNAKKKSRTIEFYEDSHVGFMKNPSIEVSSNWIKNSCFSLRSFQSTALELLLLLSQCAIIQFKVNWSFFVHSLHDSWTLFGVIEMHNTSSFPTASHGFFKRMRINGICFAVQSAVGWQSFLTLSSALMFQEPEEKIFCF